MKRKGKKKKKRERKKKKKKKEGRKKQINARAERNNELQSDSESIVEKGKNIE